MNKNNIVVTGLAALAVMASAVPSFADSFHWAGDVNRGAKITIHGDDVHIDTPKTGKTSNVHSHFHGHLGRNAKFNGVQLVNVQGRGRVELRQQPTRENGFTAVVSISEKDAPGMGHYEFTLQW